MFVVISFVLFCVIAGYILMRHMQGMLRRKNFRQSDRFVPLGDAYFTALTGALKIGDETISYYSYANQPELVAHIEALLRKGLNDRLPVPSQHGKVARVKTSLLGWRLFTAVILATAVLGMVLMVWKGILLPEERRARIIITSALGVVAVLNVLFGMVSQSILTKWRLFGDTIHIGKWQLKAAVPLQRYSASPG